ncbi:MAG: ribonuclease H-like domain-containing protein [bacterium]
MDDLRDRLNRLLKQTAARAPGEPSGDGSPKHEGISLLRERLRRIGQLGANGSAGAGAREARKSRRSLEQVVPGRVVATPYGECLEIYEVYSLEYRHGRYSLCEVLEADFNTLDRICGGRGVGPAGPEEILFMDLETTGLSLGTGTWVFLVGLGHFSGSQYHIRQFFLRNFAEEPALLYQVRKAMEPFRYLVTFNGKRFDVPLLEGRYALYRQSEGLPPMVSWDLLYPARRLWRGRLDDCRLETIEQGRLRVLRECSDIRGDRIPAAYLRYIHAGDAGDLEGVVYHNAMDVLTLASLALHVDRCLHAWNPAEVNLLSVGRYFEQKGSRQESGRCFEIVSNGGLSSEERESASFHLARHRKREGRIQEAIPHWEELIRRGSIFLPLCCEELAKHYEHTTGELDKAIRVVETALEALRLEDLRFRRRLLVRLSRLTRKKGQGL